MKKLFFGMIGTSLLLLAVVAFARPGDMGQNVGTISPEQQQFFDATRELRREMHNKRFELMELTRTGAEQEKIQALEHDMELLRTKIQAKAQELGIDNGPGECGRNGANCGMGQGMGQGMGHRMGQDMNCNGNGPCAKQQASMGCGNHGRCGQQ